VTRAVAVAVGVARNRAAAAGARPGGARVSLVAAVGGEAGPEGAGPRGAVAGGARPNRPARHAGALVVHPVNVPSLAGRVEAAT